MLSIASGKSLMKIVNKIGPKILPWGIPLVTLVVLENSLSTLTLYVLSSKNDLIQFKILPLIP